MVKTDLNSYLDKFYYKITKINELLNGKSDIGHNHDKWYSLLTHKHTGLDGKVDIICRSAGQQTTVGYRKAFRLKITNKYFDAPISFEFVQRKSRQTARVHIIFDSVTSTDPSLRAFTYDGAIEQPIYLYKESTSTWVFIFKEQSNYETVNIRFLPLSSSIKDSCTITPINEFLSDLPTDNIQVGSMISATSTRTGYMDSSDKTKLDGIDDGANKTVVDSSLSSSSTNPVQNKVVNSALNGKANSSHTHMGREIHPDFSVNSNGASTTAYRKILRITINSRYCDEPITFNLSQRNEAMHNRVHIKFKSSTDTNPDLQSFYVEGIKSMPLYLYKESTSNWILLSKEVNNYDYVSISNMLLTNRNRDYFTFTPLNEQVTTLPTTNIYTAMNTVDSSLSSTSAKPVQNKVITNALNGKANSTHTHDDRYYTEAEIDTKLDNKADSSHSHSINDVTGLSTSLDGKMNNDYSESTIESNFFAHKIGNIVIVTWWNKTLPTTQNSWIDWKTLPYKSCNTQTIWVNGDGNGCEARIRVPPNSNKLQVFISGGTGSISPGMIVYPTK